MRVTVTHNKGLQGVMKIVDDSADQLMASATTGPVVVTDVNRRWEGSTLHFSFTGRMGLLSAPIKGYVQCNESDVVIEVELPGLLKHFLSEDKVRAQVESKVRGLLSA